MSGVTEYCFWERQFTHNILSTNTPSRFFRVMGVTLHRLLEFLPPPSCGQVLGEMSKGVIKTILLLASCWKCGIFNSRNYAIYLEQTFYFNARDKFFSVSVFYFFVCLLLLKNFCAQSPCENYGTCQSGFTRKQYRCLCASGFTGYDCDKGNT